MAKINLAVILLILIAIFFWNQKHLSIKNFNNTPKPKFINLNTPTLSPSPFPIPTAKPPTKLILLNNGYHIFQTFNNCGPASLSMALSFYGINVSQKILGDELRPYQIASGINDDKSVTLSEIAEKSKDFGFVPILRPNGTPQVLINFIANNMPIIARTWTKPNEDIGHFRVIKGYDQEKMIFIQDDSLQGKNLEFSFDEFNILWEKFGYEYLVLVPPEKLEIAKQILGDDYDEGTAWQKAANTAQNQFNLSISLFHIGKMEESVKSFEQVEDMLPFRTLWYQIEPIYAYYKLNNFEKVFRITDKIINNGNRAYSEVYIIRANSYKKMGMADKAQEELGKAIFYNKNIDLSSYP